MDKTEKLDEINKQGRRNSVILGMILLLCSYLLLLFVRVSPFLKGEKSDHIKQDKEAVTRR